MKKQGAKFKKHINPHAMFGAFRAVSTLDKAQKVGIGTAYWSAFASMKSIHADEEHFHTLAASMNIGMVLAENGICGISLDDFIAGQKAMVDVWQRRARTGKLGLNATEMATIKESLLVHDLQMEAATEAHIINAMNEVIRRKDAGDVIEVEQ
jgi:hypothetical protein